ncbi:MAG TPA: prephenate dehydrogenase, partial [Clostridia bacterium]|nr:prephenate dehydrogenase [Clostridia bacterium]
MDESDFRGNIAIIGLGLIGGSYAMALRSLGGRKLFGIDIDEKVLDRGISCGVIDQGSTEAKAVLSGADIVIIALYPRETIRFIEDNAANFKAGAIITDTCGIKQPIIEAALKCLPGTVEFVGGHPMAGNEFQGFDAADRELFVNTNYIITPHEKNTPGGLMAVEGLAAAIGCGCVTKMKAGEHDRRISFTSQLPHIMALSLSNLAAGEKGIRALTGRSFMDATRVAALNRELWTQIFWMNN